MIADLKQMYEEDSVVVELVTLPAGTPKPLSRHSRSLLAAAESKESVSEKHSFPVIVLSSESVHTQLFHGHTHTTAGLPPTLRTWKSRVI